MECRMDNIETQVKPAPPDIIASLRAGFDTVANQIVIILLPIGIDLLIWLGPHIQVKSLVDKLLGSIAFANNVNTAQSGDLLSTTPELIREVTAQFSLMSLIRTIPVGIPSLMAFRFPIDTPNGGPAVLDIGNPLIAFLSVIGLVLLGLLIGTFYYLIVVQAVFDRRIRIQRAFADWSWASIHVFSLAVALLILFVAVSVPSSCVISVITLFSLPFGQIAFLLYVGLILWLAFPLIFSAHGIFVNHNTAFVAVQRSMSMTRMTLSSTALFMLSILVISEGLDILWRVPEEKSWLTLIGVGGHAFITSALLAASFIYYRDADLWTQAKIKMIKMQAGISS
jgi:hypothetical protein